MINALNLEAGILLSERKKINAISAKNIKDAEDRATLLLQKSATMASLPAAASALSQQLTEMDDSIVAKALSVFEKLRGNGHIYTIAQDIVRYAQPPEGITSRESNELLTVRA